MIDLEQLTIKSLHTGYTNKTFTVTEITQAYLDRIEKHNPALNVYITINTEAALKKAAQLDKQLNKDKNILKKKPLFGVPVALKDLFLTKNVRTTAASQVLDSFIPPYSATVWQKMDNAGAILLGKLNCDAWAHGSSGEHSYYGTTKNPWNQSKVAGGSSSGSGAAIAASLCLVATGTDTCGSIRLPASFTNTVGLKPSYGRVSRYGIISMASSLDTIGHFTKTVEDNAKVLEITAGPDAHDATTHPDTDTSYSKEINSLDYSQLTIGIPKEYFTKTLNKEINNHLLSELKKIESLGANIQEISLPHTEYGLACYYIIQTSEVSSNLGRYDGIRYGKNRSAFENEAKRRIMLGTYSLSSGYYDAYYKKANQIRQLIISDFKKAYQQVDVIYAPVAPNTAFDIGSVQDPLEMYLTDIFAAPSSLAGLAALAVPAGFSSTGLPLGFQLIGPQLSEKLLYQIAHQYQQITDWHTKVPNV